MEEGRAAPGGPRAHEAQAPSCSGASQPGGVEGPAEVEVEVHQDADSTDDRVFALQLCAPRPRSAPPRPPRCVGAPAPRPFRESGAQGRWYSADVLDSTTG